MSLQQRRLAEEPRLAAAGTADHQNVFVSGILRLLWTARHRDPFCLRHGDVLDVYKRQVQCKKTEKCGFSGSLLTYQAKHFICFTTGTVDSA